MTPVRAATYFSGLSFLLYGVMCFGSSSMVDDFHRFGMDSLRIPTGILELLGGLGLLIGLRWAPALRIAAAGLTLLMLVAFAMRVRMRDSIALSLPSFLFLLLNLYILIRSLELSPQPIKGLDEDISK